MCPWENGLSQWHPGLRFLWGRKAGCPGSHTSLFKYLPSQRPHELLSRLLQCWALPYLRRGATDLSYWILTNPQVYWGEEWSSFHSLEWNVHGRGMAALLVGCMCVHKPTDRARIYQMSSMVLSGCGLPWRGWFFCVSVTQRKGRCSYELTKMNSQIGSQGVGMGTLLPLRHLWMSSSWRGGDQGQRQTPVRQPQANNESVVFL